MASIGCPFISGLFQLLPKESSRPSNEFSSIASQYKVPIILPIWKLSWSIHHSIVKERSVTRVSCLPCTCFVLVERKSLQLQNKRKCKDSICLQEQEKMKETSLSTFSRANQWKAQIDDSSKSCAHLLKVKMLLIKKTSL